MHNRIKDLREDMDLRQIDVANATGIDQKRFLTTRPAKQIPTVFPL